MFKHYWLSWLTGALQFGWLWVGVLMEPAVRGEFQRGDGARLLGHVALALPLLILVIRYETEHETAQSVRRMSPDQVNEAARALSEAVDD